LKNTDTLGKKGFSVSGLKLRKKVQYIINCDTFIMCFCILV